MSAVLPKRLRCAVYTRKSTDERLDAEYTSIDAQRDAGAACIASRRAEGWIPVADDYDDGGFSGGTLQRPALQRLIADIEAGQIDIVVAYKIDRLSRSLFDFAELVKVFDKYNVTFVSVTQQFNTTDAMGRMLLNILLTFAQFERELTAERIRDKFAASKKKGLWMHGICPLGYDVVDRRLVVNTVEAEQVRTIFRRFVELGSILKVVQEARARGWCNKTWTTKAGTVRPGKLHDKAPSTACSIAAPIWANSSIAASTLEAPIRRSSTRRSGMRRMRCCRSTTESAPPPRAARWISY